MIYLLITWVYGCFVFFGSNAIGRYRFLDLIMVVLHLPIYIILHPLDELIKELKDIFTGRGYE